MTKYSYRIEDESKVAKASISDAKTSFKNMRETGSTMRGRYVVDAIRYLDDVLAHKQCVPMRRYAGGVGRTAQAKAFKTTRGRWPQKSAEFAKDLLLNLKANAEAKGMDVNNVVITHFQVNKAPKIHKRIYRAHGRVNPYNKSPCHIEVVAMEKEASVPKESEGPRMAISG
jgi:large subunit ribosomal protein L17e